MARKKDEQASAVREWKREQGWERLNASEQRALEAYCREYIAFISAAKTERLAHDMGVEMAEKAGFVNIDDVIAQGKRLRAGDRIYRSCYGKTLFLAQIGTDALEHGINLIGSHIDSPRLDLKPCPLYEDSSLVLFDTHYYGGIKKYQWVTIPLALHGVVYRRNGEKVVLSIGEKADEPVFMITDLLPHLGQKQAEKNLGTAFTGEDLNVLVGSRPVDKADDDKDYKAKTKLRILRYLERNYGIEEEDFASAELEIVPAGPARELGLDRSMVCGYGQDDRVCAFAALKAIVDSTDVPARTRGVVICDKEEIGSYGQTGMDSQFMENTIAELVALTTEDGGSLQVRRCLERTLMISADVTALHDPQFPDVSSTNNNMAQINCGIVLNKYTGARGKSGGSDASAEFLSRIRTCFNEQGVIWQMSEMGKVDVGGGGTIALYLARYGMSVIDCGVGLFSMHAPMEIAGKVDIYMAYKAYKAFMAL